MKDTLVYKNFVGSVHFSADDKLFFGKIEGIDDLITFDGSTVEEIIKSFHFALEDYLDLCNSLGKVNQKSYKGSFNVRMPTELHRKAVHKSHNLGISLNQLVQKAIESYI